jgi:Histidine kinase
VFAVLWADRVTDRGVHPALAYGAAVVGVAIVGTWPIARLLWPMLGKEPYWGIDNDMWLAGNAMLFHSLGVAAYAQWRGFQVAQAHLQQGERARVQQQRQLVTAQLLALQARVEPQLLFDSLRRVEQALATAPDEADQQLADLIELLRALQPAVHAKASTLARELAVVQAYARVSGQAGLAPPWLQIEAAGDARSVSFAPMVLLPLLRQLTAQPGWSWQVHAALLGQRLVLTVGAPLAGPASTRAALMALDMPTLAQRLQAVHGEGSFFRIDADRSQLRIEVDAQPPPQEAS